MICEMPLEPGAPLLQALQYPSPKHVTFKKLFGILGHHAGVPCLCQSTPRILRKNCHSAALPTEIQASRGGYPNLTFEIVLCGKGFESIQELGGAASTATTLWVVGLSLPLANKEDVLKSGHASKG